MSKAAYPVIIKLLHRLLSVHGLTPKHLPRQSIGAIVVDYQVNDIRMIIHVDADLDVIGVLSRGTVVEARELFDSKHAEASLVKQFKSLSAQSHSNTS